MSFLDDLGKTVGSAARKTAEKSKEVYEITKLNYHISAQEDIIKSTYVELGKKFYLSNKDAVPEELKTVFNKITIAQAQIEQLKQKVNQVKDLKSCTKCGNGVDKDATFCSHCGEKMN